jgi:hypothetical protein
MFRPIGIMSLLLGIIVIFSIVLCKYFNSSKIYLLIVIFTSIFYQRDTNKKNNKNYNFPETLINLSKFIIITGILGYIAVKIIGLFSSGFE